MDEGQGPKFQWVPHVLEQMKWRLICKEWVIDTIIHPDWSVNPSCPGGKAERTRVARRLPDGRWIGAVYVRLRDGTYKVITAFWQGENQ